MRTTRGEIHIRVPDPMAFFGKQFRRDRTLTIAGQKYKVVRLSTQPGKIVVRRTGTSQ